MLLCYFSASQLCDTTKTPHQPVRFIDLRDAVDAATPSWVKDRTRQHIMEHVLSRIKDDQCKQMNSAQLSRTLREVNFVVSVCLLLVLNFIESYRIVCRVVPLAPHIFWIHETDKKYSENMTGKVPPYIASNILR